VFFLIFYMNWVLLGRRGRESTLWVLNLLRLVTLATWGNLFLRLGITAMLVLRIMLLEGGDESGCCSTTRFVGKSFIRSSVSLVMPNCNVRVEVVDRRSVRLGGLRSETVCRFWKGLGPSAVVIESSFRSNLVEGFLSSSLEPWSRLRRRFEDILGGFWKSSQLALRIVSFVSFSYLLRADVEAELILLRLGIRGASSFSDPAVKLLMLSTLVNTRRSFTLFAIAEVLIPVGTMEGWKYFIGAALQVLVDSSTANPSSGQSGHESSSLKSETYWSYSSS